MVNLKEFVRQQKINSPPNQLDPEVQALIERANPQPKPSRFQRVKAFVKKMSPPNVQIRDRNVGGKIFKNVSKTIGYRKQLSSNLMKQYTGSANYRQPSPKQIQARQRFAQMQRQRQVQPRPPVDPRALDRIRQQYILQAQVPTAQRKQASGIWAGNPNSPMASKIPSNIKKYGRRTYFLEADIMGNPKILEAGDSSSFFN